MKKIFALGIAGMLALAPVVAAENFSAEGVVNAVKAKDKKLNITHGPIAGLMSGMTMDFVVVDPAMLDAVSAGSKIKFTLAKDSQGNLVVTDLEKVTVTSTKK